MALKIGDKVSFHMIPMHLCGGGGGKLSQDIIDRRAELEHPLGDLASLRRWHCSNQYRVGTRDRIGLGHEAR
jgi:hypothetical protein